MSDLAGEGRRRRGRRWRNGVLAFICVAAFAAPASASVESQIAYARGLIAFADADWEEAFLRFDAATEADPNDALAVYYRGLTQARRGAYDAATSDIRRALLIEPLLPGAPLDLGIVLFNQGRFADAQRALEVARQRDGERPAAAFFLGLSAYRLGQHDASMRWFDEAAAEPSLRQAALYYSGLASLRAQDSEGARQRLADAVAVDPASEIGRRAAGIDVRAPDSELVARSQPRALRPWAVHARTALQFDSNVVAGASGGVAGTGSDGDGRPLLMVGGSYRLATGDVGYLHAAADFNQSVHFSRRDFDLSGVRLQLDWASLPWQLHYGAGFGYEYFALDYSGFSQAIRLQPWVAYQWSERTTSQAYYRFRYRDFLSRPFDPFRDGFNNALGLRQYWSLTREWIAFVGYEFDLESPEDTGSADPWIAAGAADFENSGHQLAFGVEAPLMLPYVGESAFRGGYRLRLADFDNANSRSRLDGSSAAGVRRHDVGNTLALELAPRLDESSLGLAGVVDRIEVTIGLIGAFSGSNISTFERNRVIGSLGLRARF